jgi:hypothetical protein
MKVEMRSIIISERGRSNEACEANVVVCYINNTLWTSPDGGTGAAASRVERVAEH